MTGMQILAPAARTILETVRSSRGVETGGILVGPDRQTGASLVARASGPGPQALQLPTSFRRDTPWCQARLDEWRETMLVDWIGDWHTHPPSQPLPSPTDVASARRIVTDAELRLGRFLLLVVVGGSRTTYATAVCVTADAESIIAAGSFGDALDTGTSVLLPTPTGA